MSAKMIDPLVKSCIDQRLDVITYLLHDCKFNTERRYVYTDRQTEISHKATCLWRAAATGRLNVLELLCEKGALVDSWSDTSLTPLMIACEKGHLDIVEYMLCHKARIHNVDSQGQTCLMKAILYPEICSCLIENGIDVKTQDIFGDTALHLAAEKGFTQTAAILVKDDSTCKIKNKLGVDAVMTAAVFGRTAIVDELSRKRYNKQEMAHIHELLASSYILDGDGLHGLGKLMEADSFTSPRKYPATEKWRSSPTKKYEHVCTLDKLIEQAIKIRKKHFSVDHVYRMYAQADAAKLLAEKECYDVSLKYCEEFFNSQDVGAFQIILPYVLLTVLQSMWPLSKSEKQSEKLTGKMILFYFQHIPQATEFLLTTKRGNSPNNDIVEHYRNLKLAALHFIKLILHVDLEDSEREQLKTLVRALLAKEDTDNNLPKLVDMAKTQDTAYLDNRTRTAFFPCDDDVLDFIASLHVQDNNVMEILECPDIPGSPPRLGDEHTEDGSSVASADMAFFGQPVDEEQTSSSDEDHENDMAAAACCRGSGISKGQIEMVTDLCQTDQNIDDFAKTLNVEISGRRYAKNWFDTLRKNRTSSQLLFRDVFRGIFVPLCETLNAGLILRSLYQNGFITHEEFTKIRDIRHNQAEELLLAIGRHGADKLDQLCNFLRESLQTLLAEMLEEQLSLLKHSNSGRQSNAHK